MVPILFKDILCSTLRLCISKIFIFSKSQIKLSYAKEVIYICNKIVNKNYFSFINNYLDMCNYIHNIYKRIR